MNSAQPQLNLNRDPVFIQLAPATTQPTTTTTTTTSNAPTRKRTRDGKRVSFAPSAIDPSLVGPSAIDASRVYPSDDLQGRIRGIATAVPTICYPRRGTPRAYAKLTLGMAVLKLSVPDLTVELAGLIQMVLGTTARANPSGYKRLLKELNPSATESAKTCKYLALLCLT